MSGCSPWKPSPADALLNVKATLLLGSSLATNSASSSSESFIAFSSSADDDEDEEEEEEEVEEARGGGTRDPEPHAVPQCTVFPGHATAAPWGTGSILAPPMGNLTAVLEDRPPPPWDVAERMWLGSAGEAHLASNSRGRKAKHPLERVAPAKPRGTHTQTSRGRSSLDDDDNDDDDNDEGCAVGAGDETAGEGSSRAGSHESRKE